MRRPLLTTLTAALLAAPLAGFALAGTPGSASPATSTQAADEARVLADSAPGVPGLPSGAPPAATEAEPSLPAPQGWPFAEAFPRTSGTGRLDDGAAYWTDFVYDDHGAMGNEPQAFTGPSPLAPSRGSYTYASPAAHGNGADIFRTAVGLDATSSYWRVDWNTLVDPTVPIAEWAFDTDDNAATGTSAWPGQAGVRSPGIEQALIVSSRGAWLVDATTGSSRPVGTVSVDTKARSFVVRIPRAALQVSATWRVRMAAGVANPAGTGFAQPGLGEGALPGQPAVYNVDFRSYQQEAELVCPAGLPLDTGQHTPVPECGNFWMENDQGQTLALGDVSKYARTVDWSALASRASTPEPLPTGYTNRWYVTRLDLGQGAVANSGGAQSGTGDLRPNYLGRVQPYAVYVPTSYHAGTPAPLTWVLHSLSANHNQYGGVAPSQLVEECQDRGSICATTLGFGPDGWYFDEAEADFWQVWHDLATHYTLDPDRTVISGYSMGGWASYKLGLAYPDLFAKAMPLEGPPICGVRATTGVESAAGAGRCTTDGDSTPLVGNALWVPYVMTYGFIDELVPVSGGLEQVDAFDQKNLRYDAVIYPTEDHMVFAVQNDFSPATSRLGHPVRVLDPPRIDYTWYPHLSRADFGIGPTGAYWVRDLTARSSTPGTLDSISVTSSGIPDPATTPVRSTTLLPEPHPTPAVLWSLDWQRGAAGPTSSHLSLTLHGVSALTIDTARARFSCGPVDVTSDGPATISLDGGPGRPQSLHAPAGVSHLSVPCRGSSAPHATTAGPPARAADAPSALLAHTGASYTRIGGPAVLLLTGCGLAIRLRRAIR